MFWIAFMLFGFIVTTGVAIYVMIGAVIEWQWYGDARRIERDEIDHWLALEADQKFNDYMDERYGK